MSGWIKLHRQFRDSPYYKEPNAKAVWIECLLRASHDARVIFMKRQRIELKPGQFVMGREEFGQAIGISASNAWYWIHQFILDSMLDIKKTAKGSIVSVKNWSHYQTLDSTLDNRKTTDEQQKNTNKKDKKVKNEKEGERIVSHVFVQHARLLAGFIRKDNPAFQQKNPIDDEPTIQRWAEDIEKIVRLDHATEDQVEFVIRWIFENQSKDAVFWRRNILSGKKLREQFVRIVGQVKSAVQSQPKIVHI